ncbi:MAG: hypothetical protein ABIQ62_02850 [Thermomonas sp.]
MSFDALIQKVKQAEDALETSERRTAARWKQLKIVWKEGWTPGRIVIAGLVSGFLVGRAKPLRIASGGGVLNLVTALSGLMASGSAAAAAEEAGQAADAADAVVATAPVAHVSPTMDFGDA